VARTSRTPAAGRSASLRPVAITGDVGADALLDRDPFALLTGMLLDQQYPMEHAFAGPQKIAERLGVDHLDPAAVAALDPEEFAALCATPPAVHRYPRSMAARIQALAAVVVEQYGGDTSALWQEAATGAELLARLRALPGFGDAKARIFLALLGKQRGVTPPGWEKAAGAYADEGAFRSVADVVDPASLAEVRAFKQQQKLAAKRE
jgi:uncharacterized HhH-GPD family protein